MVSRKDILVINGPNLNMLGKREPGIYGTTTLADIEAHCQAAAKAHGLNCRFFQSNNEAAMIDAIHQASQDNLAGMVINAGAFTHTSIAIRDALAILSVPVVETHLSNTYAREEFRHHSYLAGVVTGVINGFGIHSYSLAIDAVAATLAKESS